MKRVVKFSGLTFNDPSVELNIWLNRHPKSELVDVHALINKYSEIVIIAMVDVPEGTKIYKAEIDDDDDDEDEKTVKEEETQ